MTERGPIALNGTTYRWPPLPVVVVCVAPSRLRNHDIFDFAINDVEES